MHKEITIYDLAEKLNLSASTVSRGLNDHPAISIKTKKENTEDSRRDRFSLQQFCQQSPAK